MIGAYRYNYYWNILKLFINVISMEFCRKLFFYKKRTSSLKIMKFLVLGPKWGSYFLFSMFFLMDSFVLYFKPNSYSNC